MNDPDAPVFRSIFITDRTTGILATIVNQNQFPFGKRLGKDAINAAWKELFNIIYRNNNRNHTHILPFIYVTNHLHISYKSYKRISSIFTSIFVFKESG